MKLATVTIQTRPGRAPSVADHLAFAGGLSFRTDGDHRLTGSLTLPDANTAEGLAEALQAIDGDIVSVYAQFRAA
jgi:hypothetical protein